MSFDRWIDKENEVHTYNGVLLSHRKDWNNVICSNMDATRDHHTKSVRKRKTNTIRYHLHESKIIPSEKQHVFSRIHGILGGNVNCCSHYGKQYGGSLKN